MNIFERIFPMLSKFVPLLAVAAVVLTSLFIANWILLRRKRDIGEERQFPKRIAMIVLSCFGLALILLALPISNDTKGQLLGLLGLLLSAIVALASTTFVSNAMAGFMLRAVRSFRPGDFISVDKQFGRVTERGLFHTEIQTEDRDLVTIPNLFLVTHPIRVMRSSGTIVWATVSLGYDISHDEIEKLLIEAARAADLDEPFVQISELGDFSITYRIAGFLAEVKHILTARSKLRGKMLDTLHGAGIEIVSPAFMNQRPQKEGVRFIPAQVSVETGPATPEQAPEEMIFDKAEKAERLGQLRLEHDTLREEIGALESELKKADEKDKASLEREIKRRENRINAIERLLESAENRKDE
jgi:small-conductance mechanosensitive channel